MQSQKILIVHKPGYALIRRQYSAEKSENLKLGKKNKIKLTELKHKKKKNGTEP